MQKKLYLGFIIFNLIFLFYFYPLQTVLANPNLDWEVKIPGIAYTIGTDIENNYLVYTFVDSNYSQTRILKFNIDKEIILNKTLDISISYFHAKTKIINREGFIFLIDPGVDELKIIKFDSSFNFISSSSFNDSLTYDFFSCEYLISDSDIIYLFGITEYDFLNSTHAERTEVLYKLNLNGQLLWSHAFREISKLWTETTFKIAESQNDLLYLSYENKLHKIDSETGKIVKTTEFKNRIVVLTAFEKDLCIVDEIKEGRKKVVRYIDKRGKEQWNKEIVSSFGDLALKKLEVREDKFLYNFLDTETGSLTGRAYERFYVINSKGITLVNESWYSDVYFLHKRFFSLLGYNEYYLLTYNDTEGVEGTTIISKYNYDAPPYTSDNNYLIFDFMLELFMILYIKIIKKRKINTKM